MKSFAASGHINQKSGIRPQMVMIHYSRKEGRMNRIILHPIEDNTKESFYKIQKLRKKEN